MIVDIRQLGSGDTETLLRLRMEVLAHVFAEEQKTMTATQWCELQEANRHYYLTELPREGHIPCVAEIGGEIVGCGGLCIYEEMPSPDNLSGICGYIMNVYTRENYRRRGVAKAVCKWLIKKAKARGAGKIYLETSECGKALYRSLGFNEMRDYLKLET